MSDNARQLTSAKPQTTSEHDDQRINMRAGNALLSARPRLVLETRLGLRFRGKWLREALNWEFAARDLWNCALIEAEGSDDRALQAPARRNPA